MKAVLVILVGLSVYGYVRTVDENSEEELLDKLETLDGFEREEKECQDCSSVDKRFWGGLWRNMDPAKRKKYCAKCTKPIVLLCHPTTRRRIPGFLRFILKICKKCPLKRLYPCWRYRLGKGRRDI